MDGQRVDDAEAFEDAWSDFAQECGATIAPEATYQAWLAHFAIQRLGLLRVVREVDFGARYLGPEAVVHFPGHNLMVDLLVLREQTPLPDPAVNLPRRSGLGPTLPSPAVDGSPNPRSGLERLKSFSIITELKVASTQASGLKQGAVLRDFRKLSAILSMAESHYPQAPLPTAFVGVLDNHKTKRFNFDVLTQRIADAGIRPDVRLLRFSMSSQLR